MKLAERAKNLTPSEPRKIYEEARKYSDVDSAKMLALNVIDLLYGDARTGREIAALATPMDQEEYLQKMHGYSSRIEYP